MKRKKFAVVTTFSHEGYKAYGKQMIKTFNKHWPDDVHLYVYYDVKPSEQSSKIHYRNLNESCPGLVSFKERRQIRSEINERLKKATQGKAGYKWDAVRFAHKVYAIHHASNTINADYLIWLDGDTISFENVTMKLLNFLVDDENYTTYIGRPRRFPECGFVTYNMKHKYHSEFMDRFVGLYEEDTIFNESQWHDSWLFDRIRERMVDEGKIKSRMINEPYTNKNPFMNCILGLYVDHTKGGRKHETGGSAKKCAAWRLKLRAEQERTAVDVYSHYREKQFAHWSSIGKHNKHPHKFMRELFLDATKNFNKNTNVSKRK